MIEDNNGAILIEEEVLIVDENEAEAQQEPQAPKPKFEDTDEAYGPRVQKRVAQLTRFRRQAEADRDRERTRADQAERALVELHRQKLSEFNQSLDRDIAAATQRQKRAFSESDADELAAASTEIAELAARRADAQRQLREVPQEQRQQVQATPISDETQAFIDENPWFTSDEDARDTAIAAHNSALRKGLKADTSDYFEFVKGRVKRLHPEHFKDQEEVQEEAPASRAQRQAAPVAPAKRTVPGAPQARGTLPSLTNEEADMARRMGMSPKEYAMEKAKLAAEGKL